MQVAGKVHVTARPRHQRKTTGHKDGWHNRQAIQAIGQVHGVAGTDNHEVGQQDVEQTQLWHHVFKERHHQLSGRSIFPCQVKCEGYTQRNDRHPEVFPACNQTFSVFANNFAIVINKTDNPVADENGQNTPDVRV
ncbi:hypothetical protein D3C72_1694770 [compost metagenome]